MKGDSGLCFRVSLEETLGRFWGKILERQEKVCRWDARDPRTHEGLRSRFLNKSTLCREEVRGTFSDPMPGLCQAESTFGMAVSLIVVVEDPLSNGTCLVGS